MSSIPEDVYLDVFERLPVKSLLICKSVCKYWFRIIITSPRFVKLHHDHAINLIYFGIFARLPVNSLLACKCVCKSWFLLISNPSFVKMYLDHAKQRNNSRLMFKGYQRSAGSVIYSTSYDSLLMGEIKDNIVQMDYPNRSFDLSVDLVGSCNGLVCLSWMNGGGKYVFLWNPATYEYKNIPSSEPNKHKSHFECIYGFGYDRKDEDYKVISIMPDTDAPKGSSLVKVYTLKSDCWKSCQTVPYEFSYVQCSGVLVDGSLHWFVRKKDYPLIVSFDISGENFNEVPQSKELLDSTQRQLMTMGVLDECLCVVNNNVDKVCFEVWVMRDYGVRESWAKCYIISQERIMKNNQYLMVLWAFKKGGEILFLNTTGNLKLYDPNHDSIKELNLYGIKFCSKVDYLESLVSLSSLVYARKKRRLR